MLSGLHLEGSEHKRVLPEGRTPSGCGFVNEEMKAVVVEREEEEEWLDFESFFGGEEG